MSLIDLGIAKLKLRPRCVSTFATLYGIGKIKALKLNAFLLHHPNQHKFSMDFDTLLRHPVGQNLFSKIMLDKRIRLLVAGNLRRKILMFCYQAYRLFQKLPTKGQRTRTNAGTPSHLNPYLSLKINPIFYSTLEIVYKKRELLHNARLDELKAFKKALEQKDKMQKVNRKLKAKEAKQKYYKQGKGEKKIKNER